MANSRDLMDDKEIEMKEFSSPAIDIEPIIDISKEISFQAIKIEPLQLDKIALISDLWSPFKQRKYSYDCDINLLDKWVLPSELWVLIGSFLDIKSTLQLSVSCKLLAMIITNDNSIWAKLSQAKFNRFCSPNELPEMIANLDRVPRYGMFAPNLPMQNLAAQGQNLQINLQPREIYNDQPDGWGFVLRR